MEEAGHHLPADPTTSTCKTKRNYLKCDRCRHDRKPCEFTEGFPTCKRCSDLHHECSGAKRAERKAGTKRKADEVAEGTNEAAEEDVVSQTTTTDGTLTATDRPTSKRSTGCGKMLYGMAVNNTAQKLYNRTQSDLKNTMTFEKPSIPHLATSSCRKSQELLNHASNRLKQLQDCSMSGFDGLQPKRRPTEAQDQVGESSQPIDFESGAAIIMLCTANVHTPHESVGTQFRGHVHDTFKELPKDYYLHTAKAVKNLMASIPQDDSDEWAEHRRQYGYVSRNHGPFPAFVIAWLNLDVDTAYDLWLDTVKEGTVVDVLGRSFMHLVAESGDPNPLNKMPPNFLEDAKLDGRDLSLLDLAIIGNGSSIVIKLIGENHAHPPFTRAVQRAILGNRPDLARAHLMEHLCWSTDGELGDLANLAHDHDFIALRDEIRQMMPHRFTPQDALIGLDVDLSFITEPTTVSNTPFGFPYLTQNYADTQNSYAAWNNFSAPSNTQFHRSRNDPGGGGLTHLFDPPYSPS